MPAILFQGYCTQRVPYLTCIHLWDRRVEYSLSSRHDPLKIRMGEPSMAALDENIITSESLPKMKKKRRKVEAKTSGLEDMTRILLSYTIQKHRIKRKGFQ